MLGIERRPSLRVVSAILSPLPSPRDQVLGRHLDVLEAQQRVRDGAQAHEAAAVLEGHARRVALDHEGRDLARAGVHGHDHQQLREGAVGAPQLAAVEDVVLAVGSLLGRGSHARRVGAGGGLGQREGRDLARGAARQEALLLLLAAEELDRLRHADRLVGRQQRGQVAVAAADQPHDLVVLDVAEALPAVFLGDLHAEGAQPPQAVQHGFGVLAGAVDLGRVDLVLQERLHLPEELLELGPLFLGQGEGVDEIEPEVAQEELADEAGGFPLLLPRGLGHLPGLEFADLGLLRICHGVPPID